MSDDGGGLSGFLAYLRRVAQQRAGLVDSARETSDLAAEIKRSYPPEWAETLARYNLDAEQRLRLRGIVQYSGAGDLDPNAPASSWPARTPDVADALREHPASDDLRDLLAARGYELGGDGTLRRKREGSARTSKIVNAIAWELYRFLRPVYARQLRSRDAHLPSRFLRHLTALLRPYFPDVREQQVRHAIYNRLN